MASPQFLTPKPISPSSRNRRFTLAEANRALPLVKRIVGDIVKMHDKIAALQASITTAKSKELVDLQKLLEPCIAQFQNYVDELNDVGCDLKDYQIGLVDFLGRHRGHDVCLCWKLGEETVGYWHELQTGFAGRQPVSILEE